MTKEEGIKVVTEAFFKAWQGVSQECRDAIAGDGQTTIQVTLGARVTVVLSDDEAQS